MGIIYRGSVVPKLSHDQMDENFNTLVNKKIEITGANGAAYIPYFYSGLTESLPYTNFFYNTPTGLFNFETSTTLAHTYKTIQKRGPRGTTGVSDINTGATGYSGSRGARGVGGVTGWVGQDGISGPRGDVGQTGQTGPKSTNTGDRGPMGYKGSKGEKGPTGPRGPSGANTTLSTNYIKKTTNNSPLIYTNVGTMPGLESNSIGVGTSIYNNLFIKSSSAEPCLTLNNNVNGATQIYLSRAQGSNLNETIIEMKMYSNYNMIVSSSGNYFVDMGISSDYRLKENIVERVAGELEKINKIKVYSYNRKKDLDGPREYGVLAHELSEIYPRAVSGEKDAIDEKNNIITQNVEYSLLLPSIMLSLKELTQEVEQLETYINR